MVVLVVVLARSGDAGCAYLVRHCVMHHSRSELLFRWCQRWVPVRFVVFWFAPFLTSNII